MVRGPNYVFLNIPLTGAESIETLLVEKCKGQRVTPTHETLMEIVDPKTKVFTLVRKPYHRASDIASQENAKLIPYLTWLRERDTLLAKPYKYWLKHCTDVFKVEEVHDKLPAFLLSLGYKAHVPEVKTQTFTTTIEEAEFVKKTFAEDFTIGFYSTDRRSAT